MHDHGFDTLNCRLRAEFADVHPKRNRTLDRFDDVRNGNIDSPAAERVPGRASGDSADQALVDQSGEDLIQSPWRDVAPLADLASLPRS